METLLASARFIARKTFFEASMESLHQFLRLILHLWCYMRSPAAESHFSLEIRISDSTRHSSCSVSSRNCCHFRIIPHQHVVYRGRTTSRGKVPAEAPRYWPSRRNHPNLVFHPLEPASFIRQPATRASKDPPAS